MLYINNLQNKAGNIRLDLEIKSSEMVHFPSKSIAY